MHPAVRSKTIWLGLLITVVGYLQANLTLIEVILRPIVKAETVPVVMGALNMALGLAVIVVRFLTDGPLSAKP